MFGICELVPADVYMMKYHPISPENEWKVQFINDIIVAKNGQVVVPYISNADLEDMLTVLCTSSRIFQLMKFTISLSHS